MPTDPTIRGSHGNPVTVPDPCADRHIGAGYSSTRLWRLDSCSDVRAKKAVLGDILYIPTRGLFTWRTLGQGADPALDTGDELTHVIAITGVTTGAYVEMQTDTLYVESCAMLRTVADVAPAHVYVGQRGPFGWTEATTTDSGTELTAFVAGQGGGWHFEGRSYADFLELSGSPDYLAGRCWYGGGSFNVMTDVSGVSVQVGEELQVLSVNDTNATVTNGSLVYATGAQGQRLAVNPFASGADNAGKFIGVVTHNVAAHQNCRVTTFGLVRDLDTHDFTAGQQIYSTGTAGLFGTTQPGGTVDGARVGLVVSSHPTLGVIFVSPERLPKLAGTTAGRPANSRVGRTYLNTDINALEVLTATGWKTCAMV